MNLRGTIALISILIGCFPAGSCLALPPAREVSEEILRTEVILEGRSPIDGKPLSAAEYEELQAKLAQTRFPSRLDPDIQQIIFLLQIRKFVKTIVPFY